MLFWSIRLIVLPANAEDPREVLVNVDYVFCLSKENFVPNPQIDIRICPRLSLFGLSFPGPRHGREGG
jgi:hypothetical protein